MIGTNEETFTTADLYQAAFLLANGFNLVDKREAAGKKVVIMGGKGVTSASMNFYNGRDMVSAKKFSDAYRSIKSFVFQKT